MQLAVDNEKLYRLNKKNKRVAYRSRVDSESMSMPQLIRRERMAKEQE